MNNSSLLNKAKAACTDMRQHLSGQIELDELELAARKSIIMAASKHSFYFFAKEVLGFNKLTKETHKKWADELQREWLRVDYFGRLKPRGTFKTTLYGEAFMLWVWGCFSPEIRFFYTSANEALLGDVSTHLDYFVGLKTDSLYYNVFGIKRDREARTNTNETFNIIGRDKKAKGASLMFRTAGGATN